jgi:hypothetical protein
LDPVALALPKLSGGRDFDAGHAVRARGRISPTPLPFDRRAGYHPHRRCGVIWFTVELSDKPGSLAKMAAALGESGINIGAIVGIAEDTDGALMLATSDAEGTRKVFTALGLAFEEHNAEEGFEIGDNPRVAQGLADRGLGVG